MRNAALRGIGVSALLTGASIGMNFLFISSNSLANGSPIFPFLEIGVGGLAAWWLYKWRVIKLLQGDSLLNNLTVLDSYIWP
jgi:hypothetical protein